jgi:hypothetical protein
MERLGYSHRMSRSVRLRSGLFSTKLTLRILAVANVATVGAAYVACGGNTATGAGASSGASSSSSTGIAAGGAPSSSSTGGSTSTCVGFCFDAATELGPPPPSSACLDWPGDAGDCPDAADQAVIVFLLDKNGCMEGGAATKEASDVVSGPMDAGMAGQCCYIVDWQWCIGGGRPYVAEGDPSPRVAPVSRGTTGWGSPHGRALHPDLDPDTRTALAAAWASDAQLEHASIASFGRFSLALLAFGAPPDLLEDAHRAALDEVEHARLCFALASSYAGESLAPGAFPVGDPSAPRSSACVVVLPASLADLAAATVREGCVGETVSAIVAAEQLARAHEPAVRSALETIAADEARHAELAWRTVAWALEVGGLEVRAACERAFAEALEREPEIVAAAPIATNLEAHGRLDAVTLRAVARSAMTEVVARCAQALLHRGCVGMA